MLAGNELAVWSSFWAVLNIFAYKSKWARVVHNMEIVGFNQSD